MSLTTAAVIKLILKYIGGTKLRHARKTFIESSPAARAVSGAGGFLSFLPAPVQGLLNQVISGGIGAIMINPVGSVLSTITSTLNGSTITTGLAGLVSAGKITSGDYTAIVNALTGSNSLLTAADVLTGHTNALAGILTSPDGGPDLQGIIGTADALDGMAGGQFGTAEALVPAMTTRLASGAAVATATSYINSIVGELDVGSTTPAAVIAALATHATDLTGYVVNDTVAFDAAVENVGTAADFTDLVVAAQNPSEAVQALLTQVVPPANLSILANA